MLEPLPQGMHDRRVSSTESEAQQDWPLKPTEGSVASELIVGAKRKCMYIEVEGAIQAERGHERPGWKD